MTSSCDVPLGIQRRPIRRGPRGPVDLGFFQGRAHTVNRTGIDSAGSVPRGYTGTGGNDEPRIVRYQWNFIEARLSQRVTIVGR